MKESVKTKLPPDRQRMLCDFIQYSTGEGMGMTDRYLGYVYAFLCEAESVSRRGYLKYRKEHAAEMAMSDSRTKAICTFLASLGIQVGFKLTIRKYSTMTKRKDIDGKAAEILNGFMDWLVRENTYSDHTRKSYSYSVRDFLRYTVTLTTETANSYLATIEEAGRSPKTLNHASNALQCFARYLGKNIQTRKVKVPRRLSVENVPSEQEVEQLLRYLREHNERVYIYIRLLSTTGARAHEFMKFTYEMVSAGTADLKGKGGKVRRFFFTKSVQAEVADYAARHGLSGLICVNSRSGEPMSTRGLAAAIREYGEKAGLRKEVCHCHAFRHFFAKMYLKRSKTKDITELAELMGHSGIETTMIYLQRSEKEQRKMYNKNVDW